LLSVQQGREVIVGLRSEAVRIAGPAAARPGEVHITGLVEHVEFQGHETLVHFNTRSHPAVVPDLEAPRPGRPVRRRRREGGGTVMERLRERAGALRAGRW
jgi:multiple sugar transport system ATP-binding protein